MEPNVPMKQWLVTLHKHAYNELPPELIEDRFDLWGLQHDDARTGPRWLTLTADQDLRNYERILVDDLQLDRRALGPFVSLVRRGEHGYSEACRVLHHGLKDKMRTSRHDIGPDGRDRDPTANSRWFKRACDEANEALDNPQAWDFTMPKAPQGPGATSASSSSSAAWASYSGNLVTPSGPAASSTSTSAAPGPYKKGWR